MTAYVDLLVENGDFVFSDAGMANTVADRASIAQDIKHLLIEAGLLPLLVRERSRLQRDAILNKAILAIENDARIRPGTVAFIAGANVGEYYLSAKTLEYDLIQFAISFANTPADPLVLDDRLLDQYTNFVDSAVIAVNDYL